jgi:hypothetical protein
MTAKTSTQEITSSVGKKRGGIYRGIYTILWDNRKFKLLSKDEKLVLLYLRTSPLSNLSRIYRIYLDAVVEHAGIPLDEVRKILDDLSQKGWVMYEEGIVWDKNGLRDDPYVYLNNEKHVKAIEKELLKLQDAKIVTDFCRYYGLEMPYGDGHDIADSIQEREEEKEEKKKEREKEVEAVRALEEVPLRHTHTQKFTEFSIPLMDGTDFVVTDKIASELKASFPSIDVEGVLARIEKSHRSNPKERLTKRGITPYLTKIMQSESTK